jgi:hypothetical protein
VIVRVERGRVVLLEAEELRELKIVTSEPLEADAIATALGGSPDVESWGHVWVPAETVLRLGAGQPDAWRDAAREAFRAVERFGWYDPSTDRVRIHVDA